jgi:EmrB/QacA subfamily drug resistance transporter
MTNGRTLKATPGWVLALTSAAALMVALDQLVVANALSTIQRELHASSETLEWTVNAYNLSFAVLLMTGAALGDRLGRRRMFVGGLGLFTLASAGCALAPGVGWLIVARAVQGAGSALVMPLAMALLSAAFPIETRGRALGLFTGLTGLAVVGGPVVGGAITEGLAWQWIFWINLPIAIPVILLVLARIDESYGPKIRIDSVGLGLAGFGALGLVWGLVRGNAAGWVSIEVLATLTAGAVLSALFVAWELRAAEPMLPMRFFRIGAFSAGNASAFLLYGSLYSAVYFLSQYLQVSLGYGPLAAGLRTLPWTTTVFVVAPLAGALADRIGSRPLISCGLLLQAAGLGWIAWNADHGRAYSSSIAALVIAGCGVSMAMPSVQNAVMNAVPRSAIGKASGTFNTLRQLGGVFGIAILAALFAARGGYATPAAFNHGVAPALGVSAGMSLVGAMIGLATPARRRLEVSRRTARQPALVGEGGNNAIG